MESLWESLIEETQPQKGRGARHGPADPADTGALSVQTQSCFSVCVDPLSPPAESSPDTGGLQSEGRNEDEVLYTAINNTIQ